MTTEMVESVITCPHCGTSVKETMPLNACVVRYDCAACGVQLRPKHGDCCVFCSYGSARCPPMQQLGRCCGNAT